MRQAVSQPSKAMPDAGVTTFVACKPLRPSSMENSTFCCASSFRFFHIWTSYMSLKSLPDGFVDLNMISKINPAFKIFSFIENILKLTKLLLT